MNSFYSLEELTELGFLSVGTNVLISKKASFYSPEKMIIGDNVRIDDFCILSGNIDLGSNIHISAFCGLYGKYGITMEDYTGLSPHTMVFSAVDDFGGDYLIGPIHPEVKTNIISGKVLLRKYSQIGAGSVVFPSVEVSEGSVVGSISLVNKSLEAWGIYAGIPAKKIKSRNKGLLKLI